MRTLKVCLCLSISSVVLLTGSASYAESLEDAARAALENHPSVEAARAVVEGSVQEYKAERSGYFPEVSLTGAGGRVFGDNATSRGLSVTRGSGYSYLWEGSLTARQMIFDGFETSARVDSAKALEGAADMSLLEVKEGLALRAVQSYINVLRAREALLKISAHRKKVKNFVDRIESSVDEGASDDSEYQQARDIAMMMDSLVYNYQGQLRFAESDYMEVMGHASDTEMDQPVMPPGFLPDDLQAALDWAKVNHPSVKAALYSSEAAALDVKSEKAQLYPDLDGELSYFKSDKDDIIGGEVVDAKAVMRLNWNFETGGGQISRIRKRQQDHKESMARVHEMQRQIERNIRQAYSEIQTAEALLETQRDRVKLNKQLLETYNIQFEGARITLLQVLQSENQLFTASLEQLETDYRFLAARYAALASLGRLQDVFTAKEEIQDIAPAAGEVVIEGTPRPSLTYYPGTDDTTS